MQNRTDIHSVIMQEMHQSKHASAVVNFTNTDLLHHPNTLISQSSALLGFVVRVKSLMDAPADKNLIDRIEHELHNILQNLEAEKYEPGVLLSWSYFFCTFIDEMVMARPWGIESWAQHTLLVRFHNETWGGEKCFQLINRLLLEPLRYRDLLEFIHLCLCLGFQGRYRMTVQYQEERERILRLIHQKLLSVNTVSAMERPVLLQNTVVHYGAVTPAKKYGLRNLLSVKKIVWVMIGVALTGFLIFQWQLHIQTTNIIIKLDEMLP